MVKCEEHLANVPLVRFVRIMTWIRREGRRKTRRSKNGRVQESVHRSSRL